MSGIVRALILPWLPGTHETRSHHSFFRIIVIFIRPATHHPCGLTWAQYQPVCFDNLFWRAGWSYRWCDQYNVWLFSDVWTLTRPPTGRKRTSKHVTHARARADTHTPAGGNTFSSRAPFSDWTCRCTSFRCTSRSHTSRHYGELTCFCSHFKTTLHKGDTALYFVEFITVT